MITNVTHTYSVFTYLCGDMQWSAVGANKKTVAVVGFNAKGEYFSNHPQSKTLNVADAISCTGLGRRQKRSTPRPGIPCRNDPGEDILVIANLITNCITETNNIGYDPQELAGQLDPCPCTLNMAREDIGRFVEQPGKEMCYVSGRKLSIDGMTTSLTQQCCYDGV